MINVILSIGAFLLNWFLFWFLLVVVYVFFKQYLVTRYLIAYPGVILLYNILGWIFCFCCFLFYSIGSEFYHAFINYVPYHENTSRTEKYIEMLNSSMIVSTVIATSLALFTIYKEESDYCTERNNDRLKS